MKVFIGDMMVNDYTITKEEAQGFLDLEFEREEGLYYTVLIRDVSLTPEFVHLLDTNTREGTEESDLIFPYVPPSPPSGNHMYVVEIYEQAEYIPPIEFVTRQYHPETSNPRRINLHSWINLHRLQLTDQATFFVKA